MADVKQDLLSLQYSQNFEIQGMQEANIDLQLPPASATSATLYGVVTDGALPVADATVKLFDSTGLPYQHTMTDAAGAYTLSGIPAGTYSLAAVKDGYLLSDAAGVTLSQGASTELNLTLSADPTLALGAIAGGSIANVSMSMVVDGRTYNGTVSGIIQNNAGQAVAGCFVGLYAVTTDLGVTTETLVSVTKTNTEGKYLFGGVTAGAYVVKAKLEQ